MNMNGMNEKELKQLEIKMKDNWEKIREKREEIMNDKSLCMLCYENKKNIVISGCNL